MNSSVFCLFFYGNVVTILMICSWNIYDCFMTISKPGKRSWLICLDRWVFLSESLAAVFFFPSLLFFHFYTSFWQCMGMWSEAPQLQPVLECFPAQHTPLQATHACTSSEASTTGLMFAWQQETVWTVPGSFASRTGNGIGKSARTLERRFSELKCEEKLPAIRYNLTEVQGQRGTTAAFQKICGEIGWEVIGSWMAKDSRWSEWGQRWRRTTTSRHYAVTARHGAWNIQTCFRTLTTDYDSTHLSADGSFWESMYVLQEAQAWLNEVKTRKSFGQDMPAEAQKRKSADASALGLIPPTASP